jgi:hypothetical protein
MNENSANRPCALRQTGLRGLLYSCAPQARGEHILSQS